MKITRIFIKTIIILFGALLLSPDLRAAYWEPTINGTVYKGSPNRLFILVETDDVRMTIPNANDAFSRQLNEYGYSDLGCVGSVKEFLKDNSGGLFTPNFVVLGPVRLPLPMYTENEDDKCYYRNNGLMIGHAVMYAKKMYPDMDFRMFDNDKNGVMDPIFVCYANNGPHVPWPHASGIGGTGWTDNGHNVPGLPIDSYAIGPELAPQGTMAGYTLFLHEFGHTLGMPDDYSGRLGRFSIYCDGTFNGGIIPVNLNAAERLILGWLDYDVIDKDGEYRLESLSKNKALMLKTDNPDEYFLFSNRDNSGSDTPWDSYFQHGGMLVWHIDRSQNKVTWSNDGGTHSSTAINMWYSNQPNGSPDHPCHKLIDADGRNLPYAGNYRLGMYFPGTNVTKLSSATHPHFKTWAGLPLGVEIYDIKKEPNNDITFKVKFSGNASLKVSVKNNGNLPLMDAYVSVLAEGQTEGKESGQTDPAGDFILPNLVPGKYQVMVDVDGYTVYTKEIELQAGSNVLDVKLEPANANKLIERIVFDKESLDIKVGQSILVRPNVYPLDAGNRNVSWESSDANVARIDDAGNLRGVSSGSTTITATSVQTPSVKASFKVNVSFSRESVTVTPYQRDAKVSWPGYHPEYKWKVSWRIKGASEYVSAPEQTPVSLYLNGLAPKTEYEGKIESISNKGVAPVEFAFSTSAETFNFPIIYLASSRYKVGDVIPLVALNIGTDKYNIKWKADQTLVEGGEFIPTRSGVCELRAEITYEDGSTDILIKELDILN